MKRLILPLFTIICIATACNNETKENAESEKNNSNAEVTTPPSSSSKPEDGPAIATIETDTYVMKVHRAVPFMLKPEVAGVIQVKDGYQLMVLDISVRNKTNQPLDMGLVWAGTLIKDENEKTFGNLVALAAYLEEHPDPNHETEFAALSSEQFGAGEFHRTLAYGLELPKDKKTLIISAPIKHDGSSSERKEAKFSL